MKNSKDNTKENIKGILGTGAIILPNPIYRKVIKHAHRVLDNVDSKIDKSGLSEENKKIVEKLSKSASDQNTYIGEVNIKHNGFYSPIANKKSPGSKDFIHLKKEYPASGVVLSHELGHSKHYYGRNGSKIGKIAHDLRSRIGGIESGISEISGIRPHELSNAGGTILGLASGINAGRKEAKGEKEGIVSKTSILAPLAIKTPQLVSEFEASRQGMKLLKKAGASKKYRKLAGKSLSGMLGTYAADALIPVALGYGARQLGKVVGKEIGREELEKKNQEKK